MQVVDFFPRKLPGESGCRHFFVLLAGGAIYRSGGQEVEKLKVEVSQSLRGIIVV